MSGDHGHGHPHGNDDDHDYRDVGPNEPSDPPTEPGASPTAPPSAPAPPDTHTNAGGAGSGDTDRLEAIERTVAGLVDIVAGLAPKDDRPVKLPWTHRGSARRDED